MRKSPVQPMKQLGLLFDGKTHRKSPAKKKPESIYCWTCRATIEGKERLFDGDCYFCAPVELLISLGVLKGPH
jgi:hypothetical protein